MESGLENVAVWFQDKGATSEFCCILAPVTQRFELKSVPRVW